MKKLDRYILTKFLGTFVFIMLLLLGITIVIDLSEKIDNFVEHHATFKSVVLDYQIYFIPYISSLIGPFFVLVSVIFFTSQLADRSEIIAILNSGTSFYRMLFPYFLGASILAGVFFIGNNYFIPYANMKRIAFERQFVSKPYEGLRYSFHRAVSPGTIVYMENYKPSDGTAFNFSIDRFEKGRLVYKLMAERIDWSEEKKNWKLTNFYIRKFEADKQTIVKATEADSTFSFTPNDFSFTAHNKEEMTTHELVEYIKEMYATGQPDIEFYEVERYRRTASAFSIYILTLIGVSVASRKMRGGLGWHLVLGIALSAVYEIIMKFSITFATNASLPALVAVWIPNFLFAAMAIYLVRKAPK